MSYTKYELEFFTATLLDWKPLLKQDSNKQIIVDSLKYLVTNERTYLCAFCIMDNHIHLIWQMKHPHLLKDVQRDFLKYTGQMLLKELRYTMSPMLESFRVNKRDRKYQVWQRNALTVPLRTEAVVEQKLAYIHMNPVKAGLCTLPEEYKYSSAKYYETGINDWDFLTHYKYD